MHITVCICTRDRGESIIATLRSIATSSYPDFDVVIVDQSASDDTAIAVEQTIGMDARFTYVRSSSVGASAARNVAIAHARGKVLAFTDDDCEVSEHWLELIAGYFEAQPHVGLICGEVRAGPHDTGSGFIPDYLVLTPRRTSSPWLKWRCRGISANMAFRADALQTVGLFDEMLGPGSPLFLAEDYDLTYRVLKAGYTVLSVADAYVVHHGFREWKDARILMRRSGFGTGAAYMKHVRLGDVAIVPTFFHDWLHVISVRRVLLFQRNSGLAYALWYLRGAINSFRYPIDKRHRIYGTAEPGAPPKARHHLERMSIRA
ncbi:MAG: glycosyltransferase [Ktedonobacterales bacterium]